MKDYEREENKIEERSYQGIKALNVRVRTGSLIQRLVLSDGKMTQATLL